MRRNWKKWVSRGLTGIILASCLTLAALHVYSKMALRAAEQRWRAAGGVLTYAELQPSAVPPEEQNAASYWQKAIAALPTAAQSEDASSIQWSEADEELLFTPWELTSADQERIAAVTAPAVGLALDAAQVPQCVWPIDWEQPFALAPMGTGISMKAVRLLAQVLVADAVRCARRQQFQDTEIRLLAVLRLAEDVNDAPNMIASLLALGIDAHVILHYLQPARQQHQPLPPAVMQRLSSHDYAAWLRRGLVADYCLSDQMIRETHSIFHTWPVSIWTRLTCAKLTDGYSTYLGFLREPYYQSIDEPDPYEQVANTRWYGFVRVLWPMGTRGNMHLAAQLEAKRLMLQRAVTIDPAKPLAPQAAQTIDPLTGQPFRIEQVGEGYVLWSAELEPGFRADMEERSRLNQLQILAVQVGTDQWPAVLGVEQWRERWGR